ncbi:UDP-D-xylose:L-fucose alpha-1,3-D-xylosyltransferase 3-like [Patiria miniata]|uniref:Nucleotide-diphospho-sugar transferase domain-containing protein n=1 Tax=Patiria miniata TaxID=46514 RepID=A0A914A2Z5_PATMI|nr:UDP-D-xylose:L-fucose alpha-1,3-D-xylosyltransferase 3-like [Patiria miniata]
MKSRCFSFLSGYVAFHSSSKQQLQQRPYPQVVVDKSWVSSGAVIELGSEQGTNANSTLSSGKIDNGPQIIKRKLVGNATTGKMGNASVQGSTVISASSTTSLFCSPADIERRSATVVLTTTNAGYLDVTENMLESIKRTRACPNITVIAEDEPSYQRLTQRIQSQPGLHVQRSPLGATESKSLKLHSPDYNRLVSRRPWYVLKLLEKGYDVLFVDSDTFWFRDPFKDFQGDFDIAMHNEKVDVAAFCDGFAYYRPTENSIRFVTEWVHSLDKNKHSADQIIMNQLISRKLFPRLKIKTLNETNYPDGKKYF